jgi:formiminotetrahydrofolate cyclodeaminase
VQLLELTVRAWLDELGDRSPSPGGGAAAAVAGAMAASLVTMAARLSTDWNEAGGIVAQSSILADRLAALAQTDSDVYIETLITLDHRDEIPADRRDQVLGEALGRAAEAPLAIAEAAADVAVIAAESVQRGDARVRPDVEIAVALAAAAAMAAARLVEVNLSTTRDDTRVAHARTAAEAAVQAMRDSFPPG